MLTYLSGFVMVCDRSGRAKFRFDLHISISCPLLDVRVAPRPTSTRDALVTDFVAQGSSSVLVTLPWRLIEHQSPLFCLLHHHDEERQWPVQAMGTGRGVQTS